MEMFPLLNERAVSCVFNLRMAACALLVNATEPSFQVGLTQLGVQITIKNQIRKKQRACVMLVNLKSFKRKRMLDSRLRGAASRPLPMGCEAPSSVCVGQSNTLLNSLLLRLSLPFLYPHLNSGLPEATFQFEQGFWAIEASLRIFSTAVEAGVGRSKCWRL